jgi:hypothetical protein
MLCFVDEQPQARQGLRFHQNRAIMVSVERRQEKAQAEQEISNARETILQLQGQWREEAATMRLQFEQQMQKQKQHFDQEYSQRVADLQQTFNASVQAEIRRIQEDMREDMRAAPHQMVMEAPAVMPVDDDDLEVQMVEHILQNEREMNDLAAENTRLVNNLFLWLVGDAYIVRILGAAERCHDEGA